MRGYGVYLMFDVSIELFKPHLDYVFKIFDTFTKEGWTVFRQNLSKNYAEIAFL